MGSKVEVSIWADTPSQLMGSPAEQNLSATSVASQFYQAAGQDTEPTWTVTTASFYAMYCLCVK